MSVQKNDAGAGAAATIERPKTNGAPRVRNGFGNAARLLDAQRQQRVDRAMQIARQRRFRQGG